MATNQLTKKQHYVPAFYLRLWHKSGTTDVVSHDIISRSVCEISPGGVLSPRYFYEEDSDNPDNRVENLLQRMEDECAPHFHKLNQLDLSNASSKSRVSVEKTVRGALDADTCTALKKFASYQYLRVPGAIDQKRYELQPAEMSEAQKEYALNAGRFVESGFRYIREKFQSLKMLVMISGGQDFITSDWPCFDMKESTDAPKLGEEIGVEADVVAYLPLTPRLGLVLFPGHHAPESGSHLAPPATVLFSSDAYVRNQNTLVIQQAVRFVIANERKDYIFSVADKRKKSSGVW